MTGDEVIQIHIGCSLCGKQVTQTVPVIQVEDFTYIEVPDRYCAKCKVLLNQVIDGHDNGLAGGGV